jgi:hypothetical protein
MLPSVLLGAYVVIQAGIDYGPPSVGTADPKGGQAAYVERFDPLRVHLAGTPSAGYVSLRSAKDRLPVGGYFFLAQYALAPTLLTRDARPALVVGNFNTPEVQAAFLATTRLVVVSDFGRGVVLFRNPEPQPRPPR